MAIAGEVARSDEAISVLRGAGVDADGRRVARALALAAAAGALVLAAVLAAGAVQQRSNLGALRRDGVTMRATVTSCRGLIGGSGSNLAGYACSGAIRLAGRLVGVELPGSAFHAPGSSLDVVVVAGSPPLVASPAQLAVPASPPWRGGLVPGLLVLAVLGGGAVTWRRRSAGAAAAAARSGSDAGG